MKTEIARIGWTGRWVFLASSCFVLLLGATCSDTDSPPQIAPPAPRTLEVARFEIPAGETREFDANFEIIATDSIDIEGDLVIRPTQEGDFTLTCLKGNIRLAGSIRVETSGTVRLGPVAADFSAAFAAAAGTRFGNTVKLALPPGNTGSIDLSSMGTIKAGDGADAPDKILFAWDELFTGEDGQHGGSILVYAPDGEIRFGVFVGGNTPLFQPGKGGHGQDTTLDRESFTPTSTTLEIVGGSGGDSGSLVLQAATITNMPLFNDVEAGARVLGGGEGGRGGNVLWDNSDVGYLPDSGGFLDRAVWVSSMTFRGGNGGDGAVTGGKGGYAVYWSGRAIHTRSEFPPPVNVHGGNGGNVFSSPVVASLVRGGDGGDFAVYGNAGLEGRKPSSSDPVDGESGGDVSGTGGNGGHILPDVVFVTGSGGNGAHTAAAQLDFLAELNVDGSSDFKYFAYGVCSIGGNGGDRCDGCPGGKAGRSGAVVARGGHGGDAPAPAGSVSRGGDGGSIWFADVRHANGGDGNPSGEGDCTDVAVTTSPGAGGSGGQAGTVGWVFPIDHEDCGEDGDECGSEEECIEDPTGDCWAEEGSSFTAHETATSDCGSGVSTTTWEETGVQECRTEPSWHCVWGIDGTETRSPGGTRQYEGSFSGQTFSGEAPATRTALRPWCDVDGRLYFPGTGPFTITSNDGFCDSSRTWEFSGCNPALMDRTDPGDWACCPRDGYFEIEYLPGGQPCPP